MNFKAKLYAFFKNTRAAISINAIIMLSIGLTVAAALLPSAIVTISNTTSYTGAPASVLTIVPVLGIVAIVAVLLMMLKRRS